MTREQNLIHGWRIWTVLAVVLAFAGYILLRLFTVQVLKHDEMAGKVEDTIVQKNKVLPNRGLIRDARGFLLAGDAIAQDLYLNRKALAGDDELRTVTDLLASIVDETPDDLYNRVLAYTPTVLLARRLPQDLVDQEIQLSQVHPELKAVSFDPQPRREYPNGAFASHILGYANYDNEGQYGIEGFYDEELAGKAGTVIAERDAYGNILPVGDPLYSPPVDGADMTLTIDSAVQFLVEQGLRDTIAETQSDDGMIIVMDPVTGAILALAAQPTFDPNSYNQIPRAQWDLFKNPAVENQYEPGSTFKIINYAAALDGGAVTPDTTFNCTGTIYIYGWPISNSNVTPHGLESMTQGFGRSCNIAADFASTQLGETKFYQYVQAFGFGQRTGIDMAGEISGWVHLPGDDDYSPINLYTNAFGQGISVSAMQMMAAVSAVANGGKLMKPYVVSTISRNGKVIQRNTPTVVRQVIRPETAAQVRDMMLYAVDGEYGIGKPGHVPGYRIGAKTGTAQVPGSGGYNGPGTLASAIGIMPIDNPRFVIYVLLDHPRSSMWGALTADPAMGRIGGQLLQYYKIPPTEPLPTATPTP